MNLPVGIGARFTSEGKFGIGTVPLGIGIGELSLDVDPMSFHDGDGEVFVLTAKGEIEVDRKVITNDDAAIADCFFKWLEGMAIGVDGKPVVINRKQKGE